MEVTDKMIEKVAHLAKLNVPDAEKESLKADLQKMINFVNKLNEVDTTGVEPLLHMSDNINKMREDEVKDALSVTDALKNAPVQDGSFFKVPKVIG